MLISYLIINIIIGGVVNLPQADIILSKVGEIEDMIFQRKRAAEAAVERNANQRRQNFAKPVVAVTVDHHHQPALLPSAAAASHAQHQKPSNQPAYSSHITASTSITGEINKFTLKTVPISNKDAAKSLREKVLGKRSLSTATTTTTTTEDAVIDDENMKKKLITQTDSGEIIQIASSVSSSNTNTTDGIIESKIVENEPEPEDDDDDEESIPMDNTLATVLSKVVVTPAADLPVIDPEEIKNRLKIKQNEKLDKYKETTQDTIKLHEAGWKQRYYNDPPKRENLEHGGGLERMCVTYVEGLCWVLKYYYEVSISACNRLICHTLF